MPRKPLPALSRQYSPLIAIAIVLTACAPKGDTFGPASPTHSRDTVVVSNGTEPKSIDPGLAEESAGIEIVNNAFEGLTTPAPRTLAPMPGIASSWELLDGGTRYVFHLRDAVWSDGTPVTAGDFEYSWKRALSPALGSPYAYQLWYLRNARAYTSGELKDAAQVGVRAIDAKTLEVQLERPTPFFLFLTSFATLSPVPRHAIEQYGDQWTRPQHIVVDGPYRPVKWSMQDEIVLEKNPTYWDAANVKVARIVAILNDNDNSVLNLYRTGEVDTTNPNSTPPLAAVPSLRTFKDFSAPPYLSTYWYEFNCRKPPFDDARVRRALGKAVDKKTLQASVLKGLNIPSWGLVPDLFGDLTGYRSPVTDADRYSPDDARRLLAEAGFPGGKGFPKVELIFNPGSQHSLIAEAVQSMWKTELGIDVQILNKEWKVLRSEMSEGNFQIARSGWQADYPEPSTFLTIYLGEGGQNDTGWRSAEYDRLLNDALGQADQARRNELYAKAERILIDEAPIIPIYTYSRVSVTAPKLVGMEPNLMNMNLWKHLSWR